jgi:hypothetical protein
MTTGSSSRDNIGDDDPFRGVGIKYEEGSASAGPPPGESVPHFMSRTSWWIIPLLLIVVGAFLGWTDLSDGGAEPGLRVPALIVALLLFSQGLTDFKAGGKRSMLEEVRIEVGQELLATKQRLEACSSALEKTEVALAVARGERVSKEDAAITAKPSEPPERSWLPIPGSRSGQERAVMTSMLLMGLGVWLGIQLIVTTQPVSPYLTVLSLVGAFIVFYAGARSVMTESS